MQKRRELLRMQLSTIRKIEEMLHFFTLVDCQNEISGFFAEETGYRLFIFLPHTSLDKFNSHFLSERLFKSAQRYFLSI